jgi:hypothetical protein
MVRARRVRDREIRAKKSRAEFGDELFYGVRFIAESAGEIAVEPALVARPMGVMPNSA